MERSYQQEFLFTEDLGSTLLFWIWWVHHPFYRNSTTLAYNSIYNKYEKNSVLLLIFQLLQMTLFGLAAVDDLQPAKKSKSTLSKCKDLLFSVFAFPVGMVRNTFLNILHYF